MPFKTALPFEELEAKTVNPMVPDVDVVVPVQTNVRGSLIIDEPPSVMNVLVEAVASFVTLVEYGVTVIYGLSPLL